MTLASRACISRSFEIALDVSDFARASKYLPNKINVIITADASKYKCGSVPNLIHLYVSYKLNKNAALVPITTSTSIFALNVFKFL